MNCDSCAVLPAGTRLFRIYEYGHSWVVMFMLKYEAQSYVAMIVTTTKSTGWIINLGVVVQVRLWNPYIIAVFTVMGDRFNHLQLLCITGVSQ